MRIKVPEVLPCVIYDIKELKAGMTELQFFQLLDSGSSDSATDLNEAQLVEWLMRSPAVRSMILKELSLSSTAKFNTGICDPFVKNSNAKPGDIDLLLCEFDSPNEAVAVEFKRVKIRVSEGDERINRLENIGNVSGQVRGLCKFGFSRTYFGIIAIVDGRGDKDAGFLFRGVSNQNYKLIIERLAKLEFPEEVGLLYVEIVQPVQKSINDAAKICMCVPKAAKVQHQSGDLSERIEAYFSRF